MRFRRRDILKTLPLGGLSMAACQRAPSAAEVLDQLITAPAGERAPAAGLIIMKNNIVIAQAAVGDAVIGERPFTTRTPFRAASISKLATALTAEKLHHDGVIDFDQGLREWLPSFPARGPAGENGPSLRAVLSHTGGLRDPAQYWVSHPGEIDELLTSAVFRADTDFEYCNLGYGLVASALEAATQRRFDRLVAEYVLRPMGLDCGFNWVGVSEKKRRAGASLYRETQRGWQVQTDDASTLRDTEPAILMDYDADLASYRPGQNGTLFSPQGGLRASLTDLATLAARLKYSPELTRLVWRLNDSQSNGVHDARYFTEFGTGVHIHPANESPWPGQTVWGHHGEAYGLYAGAWYVPELDISFAYAVTGTPETPPARSQRHPALNTFTQVLMEAVLAAYAASPAAK